MFKRMGDNIVQYIIVRGDLKWPKGALIGQGSHASVAAITKFYANQLTQSYLANLDQMTKIVLKAESEEQILKTSDLLRDNNIDHYVWKEQPEQIISALATAPNYRDVLKPLLKDYKLFT